MGCSRRLPCWPCRVVCAAAVASGLGACLRERVRGRERAWGGGSTERPAPPTETHGTVGVSVTATLVLAGSIEHSSQALVLSNILFCTSSASAWFQTSQFPVPILQQHFFPGKVCLFSVFSVCCVFSCGQKPSAIQPPPKAHPDSDDDGRALPGSSRQCAQHRILARSLGRPCPGADDDALESDDGCLKRRTTAAATFWQRT